MIVRLKFNIELRSTFFILKIKGYFQPNLKTKLKNMKLAKLLFAGIFCLLFTDYAAAQYCGGSGPSVCTPGTNLTLPSFSPSYDSLPCAIQGVPYDQTIQLKVPTTGGGYTLNYIQIDTITNLPCGLCWKASSSNNRFNGGAQGCIRVTGTTYDNVGQFTLRVIVTANVQVPIIGAISQANQNLADQGLKYFIRVQTPTGTCAPVDTLAPGNKATVIGAAFTASIAGSPTTFCQGGSVTLTASPSGAASYQWYNGGTPIPSATAATYVANASGNYTVKVVKGCVSSTSVATTVTVNPLPGSAITPAGPIVLCGGGTQLLTAAPTGGTSYVWTKNGANVATTSTYTALTAGSYKVIVSKGGCTDTSTAVSVSVGGGPISANATASSTTLCAGQPDTLRAAAGFTTYAWSGGGTSQTKIVTTPGKYYVTVTLTSGACTSTGIDSVTINAGTAIPSITSIPSTISGCVGTPVTLDAGAGYTTYAWSGALGTAQTAAVTSSNTYTVTVTKSGTCGSATASSVVTINPLPSFTLAVTPASPKVCPDSNITVTLDAGAGYNGYLWTGGANTQTKVITTPGSYQVVVYKTAAGCTKADSTTVTVGLIAPPATPPLTDKSFCPGDSVLLDGGFGYNGYKWNTGKTSSFIYASTAGSYSVTVTKVGACGSTSVSANVTAFTAPNAAFTKAGAVLTATAAGLTYEWYLNGNPISGASASTYTATATGNYALKVTDGNGCSATSAAQLVSVGIEDISGEIKFTASPNPVSSTLVVNFTLTKSSNTSLTITDMTGKTVSEIELGTIAGKQSVSVPMESFANGFYLVKLNTEMGKAQIKVIKQ